MQNIFRWLAMGIVVIIVLLAIGWIILFGIGIRYFGLEGGARMASSGVTALLYTPYESVKYAQSNGIDAWEKRQEDRNERKEWLDYDFRNCSSQNIGEYFRGGWDVTRTAINPDFSKDFFPLVTSRHEVDYISQECLKTSHEQPPSTLELLRIVDSEIENVKRNNYTNNKIYRSESLPRLESIRRILEMER